MKMQSLKVMTYFVILSFTLGTAFLQAAEVEDLLEAGSVKVEAGAKAQLKIDRIADQTDGLLQEFKQVNKQIESLRVYNAQLERQVASQKQMMSELETSIANATVIERGVSPLMLNMIDGLEDFINLDLPFKQEQRLRAVSDLSANVDSARFSAAEKFRQILEVYDIESEYSQSIETYRDMIDINANGSEIEVDVLRVGRVVLAYQTKDKAQTGAWNKESESWETLGTEYRRPIDQKIKAQDVIEMPITTPEIAK
jgi:uncharacterized coiled-coil protein SlyX